MDRVIKRYMERFIGRSGSPKWFPVEVQKFIGCRKLESEDPESGVILTGIPDAIAIGNDGQCYVVDYKTAAPKFEIPSYYQTQLDAYAWLLKQNDFAPIGGAYLLYFSPIDADISERLFPFDVTAVKVEVNPDRIPVLLMNAKKIIELQEPPEPSENCEWCVWRRNTRDLLKKFETITHS